MEELIQSIYDHPEDWSVSESKFTYKDQFSFWVYSGFVFFEPHDSSIVMTLRQKVRAWRAFRWWCKYAPIECVR